MKQANNEMIKVTDVDEANLLHWTIILQPVELP